MKKKSKKTEFVVESTRKKLINNILYYAGDEFESVDSVVELALESEDQLINRLIRIIDYYYDEAN